MIDARNSEQQTNGRFSLPRELELTLTVSDPEVISELFAREDGDERDRFALSALRIGVLSLRQASGFVDAMMIREEGAQLLDSVRATLTEHATNCVGSIATSLKLYFDPESGQLEQRLGRLVKKDGEIDELLNRHLGGNTSTVAQTLAKHVGEQSPIFKMLSPDQANGLIATLGKALESALGTQREQILKHFTLDDENSALSRLVAQVTGANGKLRKDLAEDVAQVRNEFSLDNEEGALSRLVKRVESAQNEISQQFSQDNEESALSKMSRLLESVNGTVGASLTLDDDKSPLFRLRRELLEVIKEVEKSNVEFQKELRETLAASKAQRQERARSTRHGDDFQDAVAAFLEHDARKRNDIIENTTNKPGSRGAKKGDFVLSLGPESSAAGARIVVEAKEEQGYNTRKALLELGQSRENREASIGIFVLSSIAAPEDMEPLTRIGEDIIAIWNPEDALSDVVLNAALSLARGLAARKAAESELLAVELTEMDDAMRRITKSAEGLAEIIRLSTTVEGHGKKIRTKAEKLQEDVEKQIERLEDHLGRLRAAAPAATA